MLWASCKDYADSTSTRVIYLSVLDLNGVWLGDIFLGDKSHLLLM